MGSEITVKCKSCDYQDSFPLGVGFIYYSLENVIHLVSPNRREKVLSMLKRTDIEEVVYEHKLLICPQCNQLAGRFDFSITFNQGKIYKPYFQCSSCHTKLVALEESIESLPCSNCGEIALTAEFPMLWD